MMIRIVTLTLALVAAGAAFAQNPPADKARGTIAAMAGDLLSVDIREGGKAQVRLSAKTLVAVVTRASRDDLKPNAYIGVAADSEMKALEVHIFAEALRGAGEGSRPFDLGPGSSMTNGALSLKVGSLESGKLTVVYAGGSQTITLPPDVPIVAVGPGSREDVKVGAGIVASGVKAEDGVIDAGFVVVGKDGVMPPM